uniref:Uncharacterized protein n=1 Tax=candidate division WOR-3 bacterium TaxID=2052148 RepID=A0A7C4XLR0_UNCW3
MTYQHKELARGGWSKIAFIEQMAHIGVEVERALSWREKNKEYSIKAIERAIELLDLTVGDSKNIRRVRELLRLREGIVDYFYLENQFRSSDELWHNYFYTFFYAVRVKGGSLKG